MSCILPFVVEGSRTIVRPEQAPVSIPLEVSLRHFLEPCLVLAIFPFVQLVSRLATASLEFLAEDSDVIVEGLAPLQLRVAVVELLAKSGNAREASWGLGGR